ncbi:RNA-binding domain-containing protein [Dubosiella muris]|uniref:AAA family ATPase n=1 Tax=Dubosiella muris TaxID=3038133 RepID=A0AC61R999_9FIRM|nr:RNA-binding domain-containing protein [Dubosiella muris]TGY66618.1 AAA family ATPase [Dubosiella muris]
MTYQESETVELKSIVVDDIKKEIIAFANSNGGKMYIGVRDDGEVLGLDEPDGTALQISNMVQDTIKPDVTMFLHYKTIEEAGKQIIEISVQRGTDRPYYIAKKGMRPEGVYVRQGYSSVPASDAAIRRMIKETDGDHFETMRCLDQELTFNATEKEFQFHNVEFGPQQMRTLKLMDPDGLYSNLALLLSDQNPYTIKIAVFQGNNQMVFKDRREFRGSLLKQMNEVYDYIDFRNQIHATIEKLSRVDVRDYPIIAIREALLNLLVHRDYSFSASSLISIYDDRIELVSIGGLLTGIELEDIMAGISICRNQNLANLFYRLHLIEAYGTGLTKIMEAYDSSLKKPILSTTKNSFKITLPNINAKDETNFASKISDNITVSFISELGRDEEQVLDYIKKHGSITRPKAEQLLGTSPSTASRLIRKMVQSGLLLQHGKARNVYYTLVK